MNNTDPRTTVLDCAYCGGPIELSESRLVAGGDLLCPHCAEECVMEREPAGHGGQWRWILVENGDDDEP
ncbi:MAG TPA: hypothetical protein VLI06_17370 [Solimonas sp.]|nr:hypothetical protein [Solimonas sp.]